MMYERKIPLPLDCGLVLTREVLNGKWKASLLHAISLDYQRPSVLSRVLAGATKRVLTAQLKELENQGLVKKKIYHQLPPKVEYSLTALGESLMPVIDAMNRWGDQNSAFLRTVIPVGDNKPATGPCPEHGHSLELHQPATAQGTDSRVH
jgi:DNA-binding HxlR family transcriptional regulator